MSIIGYIIKKAVESFPIDRKRKEALLKKLLSSVNGPEEKDGGVR